MTKPVSASGKPAPWQWQLFPVRRVNGAADAHRFGKMGRHPSNPAPPHSFEGHPQSAQFWGEASFREGAKMYATT